MQTNDKAGNEKLIAQNTIQNLNVSKGNLCEVLSALTDLIIIYDKDGRYLQIVNSKSNLLINEPENLLGKTVFDVFPPSLASRSFEVIRHVLANKKNYQFEYTLPINGVDFWFQANVSPLRKDAVIWVARDITERVEAEKKFQQSKARLEQAQAVSHTGSWEIDLDSKSIWGSAEAFRIYKIPRISPYLSLDFVQNLVNTEDRLILDEALKNLIQNQTPYDVEFRLKTKAGEPPRVLHSIATLGLAELGFPSKVIGVIQDITERKQVERALLESEENFRLFFNTIDELLFILDRNGDILFSNDTVKRRLGYTQAELTGMNVLNIHPPERREEAGVIVADMLAGSTETCPVPVMTKDGHLIPVETRVFNGTWNGQPVLYGVTKDISRLKESEEMFSLVFNANPVPMAISTFDSRFLEVNDAFLAAFGYTREEVIGKTSKELDIFVEIAERDAVIKDLSEHGTAKKHIVKIKTRCGEIRVGEFSANYLQLQEQTCLLTVMIDVTEKYKLENNLKYQNSHDTLTGLFNRQYFEEDILRLQSSRLYPISLMVLDVDGLKAINDSLGHHVGDELLRRAAAVLKSTFRPEDLVARMGGDEFVVLLPSTDEETALQAKFRLEKIIEKHNSLFPVELHLGISVGTATGKTGIRLSEVYKMADKAMYIKKFARKKINE